MHDPNQSDVSRREFVKSSVGAAAAASFAVPGLSIASSAHAAGSDTLKVGLIGCGGRGTGAASQAMNADKGVLLSAMADVARQPIENSVNALRDRNGNQVAVEEDSMFVGFDAYQQVIDSGVDMVILTTPPIFRPAHLQAAVKAGKHVFCEKPVAVDAPGVRSVLESARMAKAAGLSLMSGFCWRYSDPERATFKEIHDGRIGDIRAVYTTYLTGPLGTSPRQEGWSDMEWQLRNWQHFTWLSGDHIVEQACHSIDKMAWAMNGMLPVNCHAIGGRIARVGPERGNVYDHFGVMYEFPDGSRGFHNCRQISNCWNDNTDYIMGEKGTCYINGWAQDGHVIKGENPWQYDGPRRNMYQNEHDELFAAIRANDPVNDGDWMSHSTLMAIMGRMAAYTGEVISWDKAMNSQENLTPDSFEWGDVAMPPVAIPGQTKFV